MIKLFCLKCFFASRQHLGRGYFNRQAKSYLCIALSSRLQIIENLPASVNGLAVEQFLNQPKDQARLTLF